MLKAMPPSWISIAVLSLVQGAVVAIPRALAVPRARGRAAAAAAELLARRRARGWAAIPPASVLAFVLIAGGAQRASAQALTYLALAAGIVAMAAADTALVVSDLLQKPNNALNAAHPAAGLPRLQSAVFGRAVMGYGDLFVAAALGGLLAIAGGRAVQRRAAALTALLALGFDLLFFFVDELPATVPVALTLLLLAARRRRRPARWEPARAMRGPARRLRERWAPAAPARARDPAAGAPADRAEAARGAGARRAPRRAG